MNRSKFASATCHKCQKEFLVNRLLKKWWRDNSILPCCSDCARKPNAISHLYPTLKNGKNGKNGTTGGDRTRNTP